MTEIVWAVLSWTSGDLFQLEDIYENKYQAQVRAGEIPRSFVRCFDAWQVKTNCPGTWKRFQER